VNTVHNVHLRDAAICAALAAVTLITLWPVLDCDFVNYDDPIYVTDNHRVQQGLSLDNIRWAFTYALSNWTPLDTLSHMADCQFFGLNPRGHHATSLALHAGNVVLLFLVLRSLTGAAWRSAFVAALFALHPINVGTVAWISSRKDVLSTFFGLLTMASYIHYARVAPSDPFGRGAGSSNVTPRVVVRYLGIVGFFILALMAKPMLMTLPLVLLLLDFWPLNRTTGGATASGQAASRERVFSLVREKIPLFAVGVAFAAIASMTQLVSGSIMSSEWYPFRVRVTNALVSSVLYLWKMVWPAKLTVFYPHPGTGLPWWQITGAAIVLGAVTAAAIGARKSRPYLAVGWFWYLIMLLPVSGLIVQLGASALADRYAYVSLIGVFVMVVWGLAEVAGRLRLGASAAIAGVVLLGVFAVIAGSQVHHWRNSETLWTHALAVTEDNAIAHSSLGEVCLKQGKTDEAFNHLSEALRIAPQLYPAQNNLGILLGMRGDLKGAEEHFEKAMNLKPDYAKALANLAKCRLEEQNYAEAKRLFSEALRCMDEYDPNRKTLEDVVHELSSMENVAK